MRCGLGGEGEGLVRTGEGESRRKRRSEGVRERLKGVTEDAIFGQGAGGEDMVSKLSGGLTIPRRY